MNAFAMFVVSDINFCFQYGSKTNFKVFFNLFADTQICQPEAEAKQRCRKCECERVTDMISQNCLSLTDKTSRCAFKTGTLHRPSSLPITKDRLKCASLFLLQEQWTLLVDVCP